MPKISSIARSSLFFLQHAVMQNLFLIAVTFITSSNVPLGDQDPLDKSAEFFAYATEVAADIHVVLGDCDIEALVWLKGSDQ
jgi:hypothetical protein